MLASNTSKTSNRMTAPQPAAPVAEQVHRPTLHRWLGYAAGRPLPARHRAWVLHDCTCRTWWLRHFARRIVLIAPLLSAYLAFLPASTYVRLLTGLTAAAGVMMYSLVHLLQSTDGRIVQAGYPAGLAEAIRDKRSADRQRIASQRRRQRIAERHAQRRRQ
ncbi:MAG TPA: DUF5313 family protein, partial [Mycobacterium sp.]|nr:DUF5313 family protein [Mycobacterium sp.]